MKKRSTHIYHRSDAAKIMNFFAAIMMLIVPITSAVSLLLIDATPVHAAPVTVCYIIADSGGANGGDDLLLSVNPAGTETQIGTGLGTNNVESNAFWPGTDILYGADADELGTIDVSSGEYSTIGSFGTGDGAAGSITFDDVDGLSFDPFTGIMYGVHRREDTINLEDILIQINPGTGAHIPNAFNGDDYVVITSDSPPVNQPDIDAMAISSYDGQMYGIANNAGGGDRLVRVDKFTGDVTDVNALGVTDMEGIGFAPDGVLFGTTGSGDLDLYQINTSTGAATFDTNLTIGGDYESVDCLTARNTITGTVFEDLNSDGVFDDPGDNETASVTVNLYRDVNGNGIFDAGDIFLASQDTDANGDYSFVVAAPGAFVLDIDTSTLPPTATGLTTDNLEAADFGTSYDQVDANNNFGWESVGSPIVITKTSSEPGVVSPSDTLIYTIVVENVSLSTHNNVEVQDTLPTGVTYVASSAQKSYVTDSFTYDMGSALFDGDGTFVQSYDTTGQIPAGATLVDYSFAVAGEALDPSWLSEIGLVATYPGGTAYTLNPGAFGEGDPGVYNETRGPGSFGGTAEGTYTFEWTESWDDSGVDDNQIDSAAFTITYSPEMVVMDAAGTPPNLVTAGDGIDLQPGEAMTVTFQVTVNDPLDPGITELLNTASVTSVQQTSVLTDTAINLISGVDYDFGDLPAIYNNTLLNPDNGARHVMGSLFLGAAVDAETDGQESSDGNGDGSDDDGLVRDLDDLWTPGETVNIDATVTGGPGRLAGWFDWNGDGDFDDAGEFVDFGSVSGDQTLNLLISNDYTTSSSVSARFRLFDPNDPPPTAGDYVGSASNGEVEDYVWAYGPTAVTLQDIRVSTNTSLLAASIAGFMMLALISFGLYRFRTVMSGRK